MPRTSKSDKAATHQRILAGAAAHWRSKGPSNLTIPSAMSDAGLTTGAFFRHFESKDAFLAATLQHALDEMLVPIEEGRLTPREFVMRYASAPHVANAVPGCPLAAIAHLGDDTTSAIADELALGAGRFVALMPSKTGEDSIERRASAALLLGWVVLHRWMKVTPSDEDVAHLLTWLAPNKPPTET